MANTRPDLLSWKKKGERAGEVNVASQ